MEANCDGLLRFNIVPKVEPQDEEYILSGEFVDHVPSASTLEPLHTEDYGDPLAERIIRDNTFNLKDLGIKVKDCLYEYNHDQGPIIPSPIIKEDIKSEPEENIYDESSEVYSLPADKSFANHEGNTSGIIPIDSKTVREHPEKSKISTRWIYALNKQGLEEALQKYGLPSNGKFQDARRTLVAFIRGDLEALRLLTAEPMRSDTQEDVSSKNSRKRACRQSSETLPEKSISDQLPQAKKFKEYSIQNEDTSYSESDNDVSYQPTKSFSSNSRKKASKVKKGKPSQLNKQNVKTVPSNHKPASDSTQNNSRVVVTSQTTSQQGKDVLPEKKKKLKNDGVLWSCCEMQFEEFSAYNDHKVQKHSIEELRCAVCVDKSFLSMDEIKKHYYDVHTDSSWTSFHCLDCRLVFGVKSSFFDHKAKCSESQKVCSGILDSVLDFAVSREKSKKVKVKTDTTFRLSCCGNVISNYEDFFIHKFSEHKINLLTCGLCFCDKESELQLRIHYRRFHFSRFWERMNLRKRHDDEEEYSSSQKDKDVSAEGDGPGDCGQVGSKAVQCSALQVGILCQCLNCTKTIERKQLLDLINISLKKPHRCEPCNLNFRHKSNLNKHLSTHEGVKKYPCEICGSAYSKERGLKNHILIKHSSNPFREPCGICDKVLLKKSLKGHIARVHMNVKKYNLYYCEFCDKSLSSKDKYLKHINSLHDKSTKFICAHCDKVLYARGNLIDHIQRLHFPNETFKCQKCDDKPTFKSKAALKSHHYSKHAGKQFSCELCGKIFTMLGHLDVHMAVHSDETPYVCQTCGKGFKRPNNLYQHQFTHSDSRPHVCSICGQTFRMRTHVKQHMAVHGMGIRNHKCNVCEKTFARKGELNRHRSTHSI